MGETNMIYGTRKDEHNKLFDKFVYEMFCEPVKPSHKSKSILQSTRQKFLERMRKQKKEDPSEL